MDNIIYSNALTSLTREEIIDKVHSRVSEKRFAHILRVEAMAIQLAKQYGESVEKASLAALIHDYAKERKESDFIHYNPFEPSFIAYGNNICHGWIGAVIAKEELDIRDEAVLHAMQVHTTGDVAMSLLDKIIFVADYIEDGRTFPGVDEARLLAQHSLEQAVYYKLQHTLMHLLNHDLPLFDKTVAAYNYYNKKENHYGK